MVGHGFSVPVTGPMAQPESIAVIARGGERLGFTHAYAADHIVVPNKMASKYPYSPDGTFPSGSSYLELLTTLAFIAGVTSTCRLVTSVMVVPYRAPVHTAKILSSIDVLSSGRLTLGVGVGWMREEFEALAAPPFEERGHVTDEYIRAFKELWTSEDPQFDGDHTSFSNIAFEPKPVQKPHIPIWVGGESVPAIRRAATLGDGWVPSSIRTRDPMNTLEVFSRSLERLHAIAREAGRKPNTIEVTYHADVYDRRDAEILKNGQRKAFTGTDQEIADDVKRFAELGVSNIFWSFPGDESGELLEWMESFQDSVVPLIG